MISLLHTNSKVRRGGGARFFSFIFAFVCCSAVFSVAYVHAQQELSQADAEVIENKIETKQEEIERLEREIRQYQTRVNELASEKHTLANEVEQLELSQKKLEADIAIVQNKIDLAQEEIDQLEREIEKTEEQMRQGREAVTETVRRVYKQGSKTLMEALLAHDNLSEFWSKMDSMVSFQSSVEAGVQELIALEEELSEKKEQQEEERRTQMALREELEDKAELVVINKEEEAQLLAETANKEEEFQRMLQERIARKEAFEKELRELESQLQIAIDPGAIPTTGSGVLAWPIDDVVITQYFGNTSFATQNPQVYSGRGHNGVDFGIPTGTNIKSAAGGIVKGVGDTDRACPNASYGKWVLVEHNNGLSTLYAHLSQPTVSTGDTLSRGEVLGYSGNTGYSTGPHLHFTVYATQGVQIADLPSRGCGTVYTLPIADQDAYLNPLSFLQHTE